MGTSSRTQKPIENSSRRSRRQDDPTLRMWVSHGPDSVYFQREAQVNFWTVLGGLAMAALLTQLSPLLREIQAGRWHLVFYLLTSILVIASSWVQTSWGSLVLKWPISIFTTVTTLFGMLVQSIQCLLVTNPAGWLAATAGIICFALVVQIYFERSGAWAAFSPGSIRRFRITNRLYALFLLLCLGGAWLCHRFPTPIVEAAWGIVVLLMAVGALFMQNRGMQLEKKELGIP